MKKRIISLSCLCLIIGTYTVALSGEEKTFPFVAKVTTDKTNIRSGPNVNFESLGKLAEGTLVQITREQYGWYEILLPPGAACYVSCEFVRQEGDTGYIISNRVNLRARPALESNIIGQVNKDDRIHILGIQDRWCAIETPVSCKGWIRNDLVKYVQAGNLPHREEEGATPKQEREEGAGKAINTPAPITNPNLAIETSGILIDLGNRQTPYRYCLMNQATISYYLLAPSPEQQVKKFVLSKIRLWGRIAGEHEGKKIIKVDKIKFNR